MELKPYICCLLTTITLMLVSCGEKETGNTPEIIFPQGAYPHVTQHKGVYYYTMQTVHVDTIALYASPDIATLSQGESKIIMTSAHNGMSHFYSPELHRIDNKWYLYFEGDNGNTDNHHLYVLENPSDNPFEGEWTQHGPIITNNDWNFGIHPSTFVVGDRQYLLWSGWQKQRTENETQCIFIAEMADPWTLKSERVMISMPQYEWERQWINPDGSRSAYPIFVNENPEAMISPDGSHVVVVYSASGIWTIFNSLGMLYAPTSADLLDPRSWTKASEPKFLPGPDSPIFGTSNISVVSSPDKSTHYMLYQAKSNGPEGTRNDIRLKEITWSPQGLPDFGQP
ncbi:MAG: glycoside hydrolase family 43 protein [Muribaculaceae bacterium]|nr:glycoside hydrolase family 43 protein [Muribaculaceae bacterium]